MNEPDDNRRIFDQSGTGTLIVNGKGVDEWDETFDVGQDTRTPLALIEYRYDVPFKFTGTINKLTFTLGPQQLTAQEREQMQGTVARARD